MKKQITCFGEILWDVLPTGKVVGGAPMNVAIRLQSLGMDTQIISKIGEDGLGAELENIFEQKEIDINLIQKDTKYSTGKVLVDLDNQGKASYDIVYPSAWDYIQLNAENKKAVQNSSVFVFGSLACRSEVSKNTLFELLEMAQFKVLDVNLRPPHYDSHTVINLMKKADFIKLNDDELHEVMKELGTETNDIRVGIKELSIITNTQMVCVTQGKHGAILYANDTFFEHKGYAVKVLDTVGSGDSFLAGLLYQLLSGKDYNYSLSFACALGALVATYTGANPVIPSRDIDELMTSKDL